MKDSIKALGPPGITDVSDLTSELPPSTEGFKSTSQLLQVLTRKAVHVQAIHANGGTLQTAYANKTGSTVINPTSTADDLALGVKCVKYNVVHALNSRTCRGAAKGGYLRVTQTVQDSQSASHNVSITGLLLNQEKTLT